MFTQSCSVFLRECCNSVRWARGASWYSFKPVQVRVRQEHSRCSAPLGLYALCNICLNGASVTGVDQECVAGRWLMRCEMCATEWDRWTRGDFSMCRNNGCLLPLCAQMRPPIRARSCRRLDIAAFLRRGIENNHAKRNWRMRHAG